MGQPSDRRIHARYLLRVRVDLRGPHGFTSGTTENLSRGGLFVATEAPYSMGDRVTVKLRLLHAPEMELLGEVRWLRPAGPGGPQGMGLQLLDLTASQQALIDSFVQSGLKPLVD
jgi:uncharacterized protein (TIGR02266 family)